MSRRKTIAAAAAVLFAGVIAWDIHYVIDESEQGVLTNFGRIVPPVKGPGLHFKLPTPISMVYKIDRRVRPLTGLKQEFITEDQKNVLVDGYLLWRVSNPVRFVEAIRTETNAVKRLSDLYRSSVGIVVSNKSRDAFVSLGLAHEDMAKIAGEILDQIKSVAASDYGIDVLRAGLVEYTLPAENRPSVIKRMISERARIAARYRSEGEERAIGIEAFAINEHQKIMAAAHAEATAILGRAEADALKTLSAAYRQDPAFYKFIRALDSYDSIIDKNTTLILPADNELFKYLDGRTVPSPGQPPGQAQAQE
ncbi:MAG: protease modulator HflC [Rhodospirillaceae bacterium]|nr:protease modulator HflC [Rhodospirillaceae bacterium]MYH38342.1 protease modulator HflC [Rhodospirillaceae bacterium]MYK13732.1 protease modulator HflC [Rhodospirillaceae bacterium]MYK57236.1 protease modulator HflC [Rhodospirillaceae bacterium]